MPASVRAALIAVLLLASPASAAASPTPAPGVAKGNASATVQARPVGRAAASPSGAFGFVLPVSAPPHILVPFRRPASRFGPGHRGVDLALPAGAPVVAAGPGRVVYAAVLAGRGVVSIEHASGLRTTYEPVTATVRVGQTVTAGQLIGSVNAGHPPCAPAVCLHWGARLPDGTYLDPMTLITGLRVRLKPWTG